MKTVGEKLKEARECAGLNQEQVAEYLGVDQSLVCHWEKNLRSINLGILLKMCALYGCPEEFFDPEEDHGFRPISVAFRGSVKMDMASLDAVANIKKLALNLREINGFLGE